MEEQSNKKLIELLKRLAEVEQQHAMLSVATTVRKGKDQVTDKVESVKTQIIEQAKMYGQKIEKVEQDYLSEKADSKSVVQQYQEALEQINEEYFANTKVLIEEQQGLQSDHKEMVIKEVRIIIDKQKVKSSETYKQYSQQEKDLKNQVKDAMAKGDLDTAQSKIDELKQLKENDPLKEFDDAIAEIRKAKEEINDRLEYCEQQLEELDQSRSDKIEEATKDKNTSLTEVKKQNFIQKTFGSLFNKINGAKKFEKNVINSVKGKATQIKTEYLPEIKDQLLEQGTKVLGNIETKRQQISQRVSDTAKKASDKAVQLGVATKESLISAKDTVMEKVENTKDTVIDKAQDVVDTVTGKVSDAKDAVINAKDKAINMKDKVISTGKQTFKNLLLKGKQMKDGIIERAENALTDRIERTAAKNQELRTEMAPKDNSETNR